MKPMNKNATITHHCKAAECDHEYEIEVSGGRDACTSGPSEHWHPEEPPEFSPEECPECGTTADYDDVCEKAGEMAQAAYEDYADACYEDMKERRYEDE